MSSRGNSRKGRISFLKKRNKKLLIVACSAGGIDVARRQRVTVKSFLVLFFKKELLTILRATGTNRRGVATA
jgi:hypothetical protein